MTPHLVNLIRRLLYAETLDPRPNWAIPHIEALTWALTELAQLYPAQMAEAEALVDQERPL